MRFLEDTVNETSQSVNEETMLLDHKSDEEKMTKSKISFFEGVKTWFGGKQFSLFVFEKFFY